MAIGCRWSGAPNDTSRDRASWSCFSWKMRPDSVRLAAIFLALAVWLCAASAEPKTPAVSGGGGENEDPASQSGTASGRQDAGQQPPAQQRVMDDSIATSVRCSPTGERRHRQCTFHNLCYWPRQDKFIFLHGRESIAVGMPAERFSGGGFLDSSSVDGHNTLFFDFADVPQPAVRGHPVAMETGEHLLFRRFKPDNVMHCLHDDAVPLLHTLRRWDSRTAACSRPRAATTAGENDRERGTNSVAHDHLQESPAKLEMSPESEAGTSDGQRTESCAKSKSNEGCHGDGDHHTEAVYAEASNAQAEKAISPTDTAAAAAGSESDEAPAGGSSGESESPVSGNSEFESACRWPRLVHVDGLRPAAWFDWLRSLAPTQPPLSLDDLKRRGRDTLTCFEHAHVGLDKSSTWYQYGFYGNVQGPIMESAATAAHLHHFARHAYGTFNVPLPEPSVSFLGMEPDYGDDDAAEVTQITPCLVSRQHNRRILNEPELLKWISEWLQAKVAGARVSATTMTIEEKSPAEILQQLRGCDVLIGVHGSALSLAMFLPAGAALLELFPYAVDSELFAVYRTMAALPGSLLAYGAWENEDVGRTRAHPDRPRELGGLAHLEEAERARILASDSVQPKPCCEDPEWLYRIYQDTEVDLTTLGPVFEKLIDATAQLQRKMVLDEAPASATTLFPDRPEAVQCQLKKETEKKAAASGSGPSDGGDSHGSSGTLVTRWRPPWNGHLLTHFHAHAYAPTADDAQIFYELWVQAVGRTDYKAFRTSATMAEIDLESLHPADQYILWVRASLGRGKAPGPFAPATFCADEEDL